MKLAITLTGALASIALANPYPYQGCVYKRDDTDCVDSVNRMQWYSGQTPKTQVPKKCFQDDGYEMDCDEHTKMMKERRSNEHNMAALRNNSIKAQLEEQTRDPVKKNVEEVMVEQSEQMDLKK